MSYRLFVVYDLDKLYEITYIIIVIIINIISNIIRNIRYTYKIGIT